ncbi:hypothetical protein ACOMHN_053341 [Nucella lapillus]
MSSSPSSSSSSTLISSLLLCCFLWSTFWVSLPVSAKPAESKDGMRASMDILGDGSTKGDVTVTSSSSDHEEEEEDLPAPKTHNCTQSHRPHSNDSNKFQVLHNQVWWDQVCQIGLVWNQTLCRCDYERETKQDDGGAPNSACMDYRAHQELSGKYQQKVNGVWLTRDCSLAVSGLVWNQTSCRCAWAPEGNTHPLDFERNTPCDTMLNVTFERGLVDEAKSSFLELTSGAILALRHYKRNGGDVNTAAYFQNAVMTVWYFAGNEMSGSLRVEFRFKAEDSPLTRTSYQILLSNGCNVTGLGYTPPTLAIGYRAADRSFLLALHTANIRKAIVCTRDLDPYAWHQVSLIYEDGTLLFRVNGFPCIISSDFTGEVQKTSCPLTIGADPLEKEARYMGYMDDLLVARHCRRFVEQAPLLLEDGKEDEHTDNKEKNKDNAINAPAQSSSDAQKDSSISAKDKSVDKSGQRGDKSEDDQSDKSDQRVVKPGDKSRQRIDKSEQDSVQLNQHNDKSVPQQRGKPDQSGTKSVQHDDESAHRDDKSDDKSHLHGDKPSGDKSEGNVVNSARYSSKLSRSGRLDTATQLREKSEQVNDKSAQRSDKSAQRSDKSAQRSEKSDKSAQRSDKSAQRSDKSAQRSDKSTQHSDKSAQRSDKSAQRSDNSAQHSDKSAQRSDKSVQGSDKSAQRSDNSAQRSDKSAQRSDKSAQSEDKSAKGDNSSRHGNNSEQRDSKPAEGSNQSSPRGNGNSTRRNDKSVQEEDTSTKRKDRPAVPMKRKSKSIGETKTPTSFRAIA